MKHDFTGSAAIEQNKLSPTGDDDESRNFDGGRCGPAEHRTGIRSDEQCNVQRLDEDADEPIAKIRNDGHVDVEPVG